MELNLRQDFEFSGKEYSPRRSAAKTAANRQILRADSTPADMISGWNNYLDTLYREQSKLYNDIQAARTLGLSDAEIRRNLVQKANLGTREVAVIMKGQFFPGTASREVLKDVAMQLQEGRTRLTSMREVPAREMNELSIARTLEPLSPDLFRKRQAENVDAAEPAPVSGYQLPEPISSTAGYVLPEPIGPATGPVPAPAAPQAPQAPAATTPPSPSLLGGNLIDQLRNSEIAQRLSGQ
jgi:hypothetical protein